MEFPCLYPWSFLNVLTFHFLFLTLDNIIFRPHFSMFMWYSCEIMILSFFPNVTAVASHIATLLHSVFWPELWFCHTPEQIKSIIFICYVNTWYIFYICFKSEVNLLISLQVCCPCQGFLLFPTVQCDHWKTKHVYIEVDEFLNFLFLS